jgi:hypothetical protein
LSGVTVNLNDTTVTLSPTLGDQVAIINENSQLVSIPSITSQQATVVSQAGATVVTVYNGELYSATINNDNSGVVNGSTTNSYLDVANCEKNNMQLISLRYEPINLPEVQVWFNGLLLQYLIDYTIVNGVIFATNSLNVQYGGTTNDGAGFASSDEITALYNY